MKEKRQVKRIAAAVLIGMSVVSAGCGSTKNAGPKALDASPTTEAVLPTASSAETTAVMAPSVTPAAIDTKNGEASIVQPASANDAHSAAPKTEQPKKEFEPYTSSKPLLMGVAIGDSKEKATSLHGKPPHQSKMDDDEDPLTVLEYDGFQIGINGSDQTEFVEITDSTVNPGLNGLRLGQLSDRAVEALGKPDSNTEFVLSYKTKTTVLKLDVDPKTKEVRSIKLFGRSE